MNLKDAVVRLLNARRRASPADVFPAATVERVVGCEARLGLHFPPQYREFLTFCNGALAGEEAIYGVKPEKELFDVELRYNSRRSWIDWKMIPIAGDGCGNYYLLDADGGERQCVYFFDTIGHDRPGYVVASDFWHFAYFYITKPDKKGWPTKKSYVLRIDPGLRQPCKAPPIWEL